MRKAEMGLQHRRDMWGGGKERKDDEKQLTSTEK
jgi:hypothetical protein